MSTGRHWKAVCSLPKYSFFKDINENICRVENKSGNWIEVHKAQEIVDNAETDIHELQSALNYQLQKMQADAAMQMQRSQNQSRYWLIQSWRLIINLPRRVRLFTI